MSLLIDGKEGSDIATTDIVGAYILTTMEEGVLIKLIGHIVNMMCQINHRYLPYVTQEGDKKKCYSCNSRKHFMVAYNQPYYGMLFLRIV